MSSMAYVRRGVNQLTWDDFPTFKDAEGWHCRFCKTALTGRKRAWCNKACEKEVLLRVHWRYIRSRILRRDKWRCQMVLSSGITCLRPADEVDHIIEMVDGGSFHEWSNLRSLCHECHNTKTQMMRKARAEAKKSLETMQKEGHPVLVTDGPVKKKSRFDEYTKSLKE